MAKATSGGERGKAAPAPEADAGLPACGIVMPISDTVNHSASHWSDVNRLLHRAVSDAGFQPQNVWSGEGKDRITERILSNLFAAPIAVCDISDLNANVMVELGMRLTSKKPTVVVVEKGGDIPFDIGDFEALDYPPDLNIFGMEAFFERLADHLRIKHEAAEAGTYEPFLKGIGPIEFLEPDVRAAPFEELVVKRLDAMTERLEALDAGRRAGSSFAKPTSEVGTITVVPLDMADMSGALAALRGISFVLLASTSGSQIKLLVKKGDHHEMAARAIDKHLSDAGIPAKVEVV
jgi:hypothetical protein